MSIPGASPMLRRHHFAALISLLLAAPLAHATNFSYTGTFSHDTDLATFTFTLNAPTPGVTLRTWSYAGGTNADGQLIPAGGFEPLLNLYMSDGTGMNPGYAGLFPGFAGTCTSSPGPGDLTLDPVSGACADVYYPTTRSFPGGVWAPGTYTIVLSTFANPGIGNLSDGFFAEQVLGLTPPGNFICSMYEGSPPSIPLDQPFCDEWNPGVQRDGHWALDILNVDSVTRSGTSLPEPGTLALMAAALTMLAWLGWRRRAISRP